MRAFGVVSWLVVLAWCGLAQRVQAQADAGARAATDTTPTYGARARVAAPEPAPSAPDSVQPAAAEALSEHLGSSFSFEESMPGALPVFSGVPYVIVRGAPPSATRTYYDGIALPTLFHVALMPAIVNQHLIGGLRLYPALGPARYGRKLGGAFVVDGVELDPDHHDETVRELSLSLLDASGYLQTPLDDGTFVAAWRMGDPSLALAALGLNARLAYYDYQFRYERRSASGERVLLLALGSGDTLGDRTVPEQDISLDVQRLLVRYTRPLPAFELGSELQLGYDSSKLGQELTGSALRIGPAVYTQWRSANVRTRVGMDFAGVLVSVDRNHLTGAQAASAASSSTVPRAPKFTLDPQDFLDQAPLARVPTRNAFGLYGELELKLSSRVSTELGLRSDLYTAGNSSAASLDPSGRLTYQLAEALRAHAGVGLAHSPVTSPIPLPGLDDIAFDRGVQSAVQSELGSSLALGKDTRLDATLFYDRFIDSVFLELILDCQGNTDPQAAQAVIANVPSATSICRQQGLPRANGDTYGLELYLERELTQRLSGFVSYTLSFADATAQDGTHFTPQSDVRHVANAVLQYDFGGGFSAGMRLHARSGKMGVNTVFDVPTWHFERIERRLPGFFRADVHASYRFRTALGRMEAGVSWLNVTFSREATKRDCAFNAQLAIECRVDYQPAIVLPNVSLSGEL